MLFVKVFLVKPIAPQLVSKHSVNETLRFITMHVSFRIVKLITRLHLVHRLRLRGTSPPPYIRLLLKFISTR
jgi:hypothetical protein